MVVKESKTTSVMERPKLVFKSKEHAYFSIMNIVGDLLLNELYLDAEDKNVKKELDRIDYSFSLQISDKEPKSYEISYSVKFVNDGKEICIPGEDSFKRDDSE